MAQTEAAQNAHLSIVFSSQQSLTATNHFSCHLPKGEKGSGSQIPSLAQKLGHFPLNCHSYLLNMVAETAPALSELERRI